MPPTPPHCAWFEDTETTLQTRDGKEVRVIRFNHQNDEVVLREWASHFRSHYSSPEDLAAASAAMGISQSDYLRDIKFPGDTAPGPSIRAGDFSEILVADYVQFLMNYTVPRTRYDRKVNRNSSTLSVDILGYKFAGGRPIDDELISCEVKSTLGTRVANTLQNALDDSKKDFETRLPFALNATHQRLKDRGEVEMAREIERFMNKTARPYRNISGAVLMCSEGIWNEVLATNVDAAHPNTNLTLLVFVGQDLMTLAHRLYETAYATA